MCSKCELAKWFLPQQFQLLRTTSVVSPTAISTIAYIVSIKQLLGVVLSCRDLHMLQHSLLSCLVTLQFPVRVHAQLIFRPAWEVSALHVAVNLPDLVV